MPLAYWISLPDAFLKLDEQVLLVDSNCSLYIDSLDSPACSDSEQCTVACSDPTAGSTSAGEIVGSLLGGMALGGILALTAVGITGVYCHLRRIRAKQEKVLESAPSDEEYEPMDWDDGEPATTVEGSESPEHNPDTSDCLHYPQTTVPVTPHGNVQQSAAEPDEDHDYEDPRLFVQLPLCDLQPNLDQCNVNVRAQSEDTAMATATPNPVKEVSTSALAGAARPLSHKHQVLPPSDTKPPQKHKPLTPGVKDRRMKAKGVPTTSAPVLTPAKQGVSGPRGLASTGAALLSKSTEDVPRKADPAGQKATKKR